MEKHKILWVFNIKKTNNTLLARRLDLLLINKKKELIVKLIPAGYIVKRKESEKLNKYLVLAR